MGTLKRKNIILIPYPAQGHVTPMLKLASVLSNLHFRPVVITPEFIHRRLQPPADDRDGILLLPITDGLGGSGRPDFFAIERAMEETMPVFLEELVQRMISGDDDGDGGEGVACLVVDLLASWAVAVGRRCGVAVAGFWPAMHATYRVIDAIPELIETGVISENGCPTNPDAPLCLFPNEPTLTANDLPWLIGSSSARIARFKFWTRALERSRALRHLLMNTFPGEMELQTTQQLTKVIKTPHAFEIGPLIMQATTINNPSLWDEDTCCIDWLDKRTAGSVLYVSFGSWVSPIEESKIETLALALALRGKPFVWVLGPAWRQGLPHGYAERVASHGRVVSWAPQVEVLRHPAVGCYLTHCGWNSTVEGIRCGKPLLCYPIAGDQSLVCACIVQVWKIGVRIKGFEIEEVEEGIRKVVGNEQVMQRMGRLNEKMFGEEGRAKAMADLSTFIQDLGE